MKLVAEYVSPGHPDRLADAVVESIVDYVISKDKDALCGIECAVHSNKVFVDGRIAAGRDKKVIDKGVIKKIVRNVYKEAGYGYSLPKVSNAKYWKPYPEDLIIIPEICIETLSDDERDLRKYSDDQNVVIGYATNNEKSNYLPIEHYLAQYIGKELLFKHKGYKRKYYGPDFKVLVELDYINNKYIWSRLTISQQTSLLISHKRLLEEYYDDITDILESLDSSFGELRKIDLDKLYLNGAGDFIIGGPEGDNGLSGKKLAIDFYGPNIPIGGGAICGKDPHKVDVCGAFRARELAVSLVKEYGYHSVLTRLAWSPGESSPNSIEAYEIDEFGTRNEIDISKIKSKDWFSIECINKDMALDTVSKKGTMLNGYMNLYNN